MHHCLEWPCALGWGLGSIMEIGVDWETHIYAFLLPSPSPHVFTGRDAGWFFLTEFLWKFPNLFVCLLTVRVVSVLITLKSSFGFVICFHLGSLPSEEHLVSLLVPPRCNMFGSNKAKYRNDSFSKHRAGKATSKKNRSFRDSASLRHLEKASQVSPVVGQGIPVSPK